MAAVVATPVSPTELDPDRIEEEIRGGPEAEEEVAPPQTTGPGTRLSKLPLARIKALMKTDPDVSLASQESVFIIAKATVNNKHGGGGSPETTQSCLKLSQCDTRFKVQGCYCHSYIAAVQCRYINGNLRSQASPTEQHNNTDKIVKIVQVNRTEYNPLLSLYRYNEMSGATPFLSCHQNTNQIGYK